MYACVFCYDGDSIEFCTRNYAWNSSYDIMKNILEMSQWLKKMCDKLNIIVCDVQRVFTYVCKTCSEISEH